jgi:PRTRC genetic system protein C
MSTTASTYRKKEGTKMPIDVKPLSREFIFDGRTLPDPDPDKFVEQVREMYIPTIPEITTAKVVGPECVDGKLRYTFTRAIGDKG